MSGTEICKYMQYCNLGVLRVGDVIIGSRYIENTTKMRPFEERAVIVGVRNGEVLAVLEAVEMQIMNLESMRWIYAEIEDTKRRAQIWSPIDIVNSVIRTPLQYRLDNSISQVLLERLISNIIDSSEEYQSDEEARAPFRESVPNQNYIEQLKSLARNQSQHLFFQELYSIQSSSESLEGDLLTDWFLYKTDCNVSTESVEREYIGSYVRNYELDMGLPSVSSYNANFALIASEQIINESSFSSEQDTSDISCSAIVFALTIAATTAALQKNLFCSLPESRRSIASLLDGERIKRIMQGLRSSDKCCFRYAFTKAEQEKQRKSENVVGRAAQRKIERGAMKVIIASHPKDIISCTTCGKVCVAQGRGEHTCSKKNFFKDLTYQTLTPLTCAISCAISPKEGLEPERALQKLLEACKHYSFTTQSKFLLMESFTSLEVSLTIPYDTREPLFLRESPNNKRRNKFLPVCNSSLVTATLFVS